MCICVYVYVYMCVCVCVYIYIDKYPALNHINRVLNTVVERVEKKKRQT